MLIVTCRPIWGDSGFSLFFSYPQGFGCADAERKRKQDIQARTATRET
jgi:hypothetical protein